MSKAQQNSETGAKPIESMTPRAARIAAGLKPRELAAKVPCSLTTVYAAENSGSWPAHRALRAVYIRALSKALAKAKAQA